MSKFTKEVEVDLSSDDLAEMFIGWGDDEQGKFFNLIGSHFKQADFSAEMQAAYISNNIDKDGKDFLFTLCNFIKVCKLPSNSPKIDQLINLYECDSL